MGLGIGDYNLDGNLDIFKTHFADDTGILYRNDGKGAFDVTPLSPPDWAWRRAIPAGAPPWWTSTTMGSLDLFFVTGSIYPELKLESLPVSHAARGVSAIWAAASSRSCSTRPVPASLRRTPAAAAHSAISTTTVISTLS